MRILVCGGRDYDNWSAVREALDTHNPSVLIHGGASGADRLAGKWADVHGVPTIVFPANWRQGKKAGPLRNRFMLSEGKPDLVLAFPGGRGTADMVSVARAAGVAVHEPHPQPRTVERAK